jgi:CRISPR-associated protein Csd1
MLTALYDYAKSRGLLADTSYERRRIDLVLTLDATGRFLGLIPADQGLELEVPRQESRTSGICPGFVVDNAKYVFGIAQAGAKPKDIERARMCQAAYLALLEKAASAYPEAAQALAPLLEFSRNIEANRERILRERPEWNGGENIATRVGEEWVHEQPGVRAAWNAMRGASGSALEPVRCLVTGELAPPELKHPPLKRVPGTQQAHTMLVSFNADAFTSMGFVQAQNAQVSRIGAEGYVTALNELMRKDPSKSRPYASGIKLGSDNVILVWTAKPTSELDNLLDLLEERTADDALEDIGAPFTGRLAASDADDSDFYAVTLGGNAARVVVRDWFQSRFGEVKANVRSWFRDLEVSGADRPPAIWQLLQSIEPPGDASVPPSLAAALGHSALFGGRVPLELMRHALMRLRIPPKPKEKFALQHRIALIKLTLIRTLKQEVPVALDEDKKDVPYLLGRLFAVLERLQSAALGDVNATIRDRYFGAASSSPAVVFPRLIRLSVYHASKSGADWLEKLKGSIMASLPAEQFPQILSLEDQGLFAVGYYQQREKFFEKRSTTPTNDDKETE